MALYTFGDAYAAADRATSRAGRNMDSLFEEQRKLAKAKSNFDIFLSHSSSDARLIFGAKQLLE